MITAKMNQGDSNKVRPNTSSLHQNSWTVYTDLYGKKRSSYGLIYAMVLFLHLRNKRFKSTLNSSRHVASPITSPTTAGVHCSRNYFTISDRVQYTERPKELFLSYIHRHNWNVAVHVVNTKKLHNGSIIRL